ncbi:MAG: hypothetical protein DRN78_00085 [Thermoproteota archaeon]|nr:MAG: hypothetical protein DRN78_00085 [Candidatus Korarchaeota archaeon]
MTETPFVKYTDMSYYDGAIKNPDYYIREKGIVCTVEEMSPDEYLDRCYRMHLKRMKEPISKEYYLEAVIHKPLAEEYAKMMEKGAKFPMPVLDYKILEQEGRHRAYASKLLGIKKIPVLVCRSVD